MQLFSDDLFIARLALLTDVFEKLNELNISLQGRGKWVFELQTSICAFVNKLTIFVTRAKTGDFCLFPHYKEFLATTGSEMSFPSVKHDLVQYLTNLQANFKERFPELEEVLYRHVQFPFRVDAEACGDLVLQVTELQADENQKIQFEDYDLPSFCLNAPKKYAFLKNEATKTLVQFGSTHGWRNLFQSGGHKCTSKNNRQFLWFESATVPSQALKYDVITYTLYESPNYTILDEITPL